MRYLVCTSPSYVQLPFVPLTIINVKITGKTSPDHT